MEHRHIGFKNIQNIKQPKAESSKNIEIDNDGDFLTIRLKKSFLLSNPTYDIHKLILTATSPFFLNQNKNIVNSIKSTPNNPFKHIAFFIEYVPHYTGGRYSIFLQALLLSQYTKVSVITTMKPVFYDDFKDYYNDNFRLILSQNYLSNISDNDFDLVVGVPQLSGQYAADYAKKWSLPLYMVIFESPNYVSEYRDGVDSTEEYWSNYKRKMKECDKIIVPSFESAKWVKKWDSEFEKIPVQVVYPCINEIVAKKVNDEVLDQNDNSKSVVYISRMTAFKNPVRIFQKLSDDCTIHVIGKIWGETKKRIDELNLKNVIIHGSIGDVEKFRIIRDCDVVIFPTTFEGHGMPPAEAFYFNKPVITYDLPVLREIYGKYPVYVPVKDEYTFIQKIQEVLRGSKINTNYDEFSDKLKHIRIKDNADHLLSIYEIPKVTTGTIVYNGDDYLEYAIKSLYPYMYQMIIVEGAVENYSDNSHSTDGTYKIIKKLMSNDIMKKLIFVRNKHFWKNKIEMQNAIAKRIEGDFYIKLDHDEIWKEKALFEVINLFLNRTDLTMVRMPFLHFWLNFKTVAKDAGGKWSTKHPRVWRWKKEFKHKDSFNYFQDKKFQKVGSPFYDEVEYQEEFIYHFGYCRKYNTIMEKLEYYKNRGIEKVVVDTITNWEKDKRTQPTQSVRSWAEPFVGSLPKVLNSHPYLNVSDIRKEQDHE